MQDEPKNVKPEAESCADAAPVKRGCIVLRRAASVALSAVLFFVLLFGAAVFTLRSSLESDSVSAWIDNSSGLSEISIQTGVGGESVSLTDYVYDVCRERGISEKLTRDGVGKLLELPFAKELLKTAYNSYKNYIMTGKSDGTALSPETIAELIRENESEIRRVLSEEEIGTDDVGEKINYDEIERELTELFGSKITPEEIFGNASNGGDAGKDTSDGSPSAQSETDGAYLSTVCASGRRVSVRAAAASGAKEDILSGVRFLLSNTIVWVTAILAAVICAAVIVLNRRNPGAILLYFGVPFILSGTAMAVLPAVASALLGTLAGLISGSAMTAGIILLCVGIVMTAAGTALTVIAVKKRG